MPGILSRAEASLIARQQWTQGFKRTRIRPSYDGLGLANVPALILQWLGADKDGFAATTLPPLQPQLLGDELVTKAWEQWLNAGAINHVIFLILDGLGYDQLQDLIANGDTPNLAQACSSPQAFFMPITSVFPSTTTVALTSAATATSPAQHGILATSMYLRELGSIVDFIAWRPKISPTNAPLLDTQLNPDTFVPVPNIYLRLEQTGVNTEIVNYHAFKQSSISRYTSVGSKAGKDGFHGYLTPQQGFVQLRDTLGVKPSAERISTQVGPKSFTYMYVPNVDASAHRHAPLSPHYRAEIIGIDFALEREILQPLQGREDTVLILIADHGQRVTNKEQILWLNDHPGITDHLFVPPTGSSQARYLHVKHHREAQVINYIENYLDDDFMVISTDTACQLGLFGLADIPPYSRDRIGDLIVFPRDEWSCFHSFPPVSLEDRKNVNAGLHGGLSRAEMLIPFLAYRF